MSCSSISVFHCFFAWSAVARARLGTHIAEYTIGLPVWPTPGPPHATTPSLKFGDDGPVRSQHRPQPPERGSAAGAAAAAAGASINRMQERVILGDKN